MWDGMPASQATLAQASLKLSAFGSQGQKKAPAWSSELATIVHTDLRATLQPHMTCMRFRETCAC